MACNMVLVIMAERWPQATTYRDTFEALSQKTINMICSDQTHSSGVFADNRGTRASETTRTNQSGSTQDCFMDFDYIPVSDESEWFIQELLQDIRNYKAPDITFDDLADFTT